MKKLFLLLLCSLAGQMASARVTLPGIFSDGMVMQRETQANIWGTARVNATVTLTTSWDNKRYQARADSNGRWRQAIQTPAAGGPYTITLHDGETTTLRDVLIGEVWVCSGHTIKGTGS